MTQPEPYQFFWFPAQDRVAIRFADALGADMHVFEINAAGEYNLLGVQPATFTPSVLLLSHDGDTGSPATNQKSTLGLAWYPNRMENPVLLIEARLDPALRAPYHSSRPDTVFYYGLTTDAEGRIQPVEAAAHDFAGTNRWLLRVAALRETQTDGSAPRITIGPAEQPGGGTSEGAVAHVNFQAHQDGISLTLRVPGNPLAKLPFRLWRCNPQIERVISSVPLVAEANENPMIDRVTTISDSTLLSFRYEVDVHRLAHMTIEEMDLFLPDARPAGCVICVDGIPVEDAVGVRYCQGELCPVNDESPQWASEEAIDDVKRQFERAPQASGPLEWITPQEMAATLVAEDEANLLAIQPQLARFRDNSHLVQQLGFLVAAGSLPVGIRESMLEMAARISSAVGGRHPRETSRILDWFVDDPAPLEILASWPELVPGRPIPVESLNRALDTFSLKPFTLAMWLCKELASLSDDGVPKAASQEIQDAVARLTCRQIAGLLQAVFDQVDPTDVETCVLAGKIPQNWEQLSSFAADLRAQANRQEVERRAREEQMTLKERLLAEVMEKERLYHEQLEAEKAEKLRREEQEAVNRKTFGEIQELCETIAWPVPETGKDIPALLEAWVATCRPWLEREISTMATRDGLVRDHLRTYRLKMEIPDDTGTITKDWREAAVISPANPAEACAGILRFLKKWQRMMEQRRQIAVNLLVMTSQKVKAGWLKASASAEAQALFPDVDISAASAVPAGPRRPLPQQTAGMESEQPAALPPSGLSSSPSLPAMADTRDFPVGEPVVENFDGATKPPSQTENIPAVPSTETLKTLAALCEQWAGNQGTCPSIFHHQSERFKTLSLGDQDPGLTMAWEKLRGLEARTRSFLASPSGDGSALTGEWDALIQQEGAVLRDVGSRLKERLRLLAQKYSTQLSDAAIPPPSNLPQSPFRWTLANLEEVADLLATPN